MTDEVPSVSPDLMSLAELIDQSSLGGANVREAQAEVTPDVTMRLRDLIFLDRPAPNWQKLPESTSLLKVLGEAVPNGDGSLDGLGLSFPDGAPVYAVNHRGEAYRFSDLPIRLPGRSERALWKFYSAAAGKHRCELDMSFRAASGSVRIEVRVGLVWEVIDAKKLAGVGIGDVKQLLKLAEAALEKIEGAGNASFRAELIISRTIEQTCQDHGVEVEPALAVRTPLVELPAQQHLRSQQTQRDGLESAKYRETMRFMESMYRVEVHSMASDYQQTIDSVTEIACAEPSEREVLERVFPRLIEALRALLGFDSEEAVEAAHAVLLEALRTGPRPIDDETIIALSAAAVLAPADIPIPRPIRHDARTSAYEELLLRHREILERLARSGMNPDEATERQRSRYGYHDSFAP